MLRRIFVRIQTHTRARVCRHHCHARYADSEDVILFASRNIHYLVDKAGQFNENYYGMKHELIECILSEQSYVDLNDRHVFKQFKLSELLTESKTVLYFPDFLLQVGRSPATD